MADCPHQFCKDKPECDLWPKLPEGSEFPQPASPVAWELLKKLADKPHPLIRLVDLPDHLWGVTELLYEVRAAHHLLDLAEVPQRYSLDTGTIDARMLVAFIGMSTLRERLARISGWHERETGPAGTVGDYCTECGRPWPCDSLRMADGTYVDPDDEPEPEPAPGGDRNA